MSVATNDIFLITWDGLCNAQRIMLTLTYRISQILAAPFDEKSVSEDMVNRLTTGGLDLMQTTYLNCLPQNYGLANVTAQKIWPVRYRRWGLAIADTGNIANDALSANVAAVISLHSDEAGRSQVANKHIGPLATAVGWYTDGSLTAGYKAVLDSLKTAFLQPITSAGWYTAVPCIYHKGDVVPKWNDTIGGNRKDTVRVMRRRTVGLGE